ncbi:hypothetical protein RF11_10875 [Thelohanellus kitauei]|nr:hypothetical protein RF11_10875 [Thelohanellus kitauei]
MLPNDKKKLLKSLYKPTENLITTTENIVLPMDADIRRLYLIITVMYIRRFFGRKLSKYYAFIRWRNRIGVGVCLSFAVLAIIKGATLPFDVPAYWDREYSFYEPLIGTEEFYQ